MQLGKIHQIIDNKNEKLEREALNEAEMIIEEITRLQNINETNDKKIASLREQLQKLEITQLDRTKILG